MKALHWLFIALIIFAVWTLYHNYSKHPGSGLV